MTSQPDTVLSGRVRGRHGWTPGEVWLRDGVVTQVREERTWVARPDVRTIDVGDAYVLPGVVDAHVHSLSHGGEGIAAATRAAAAGGVTTIVEMPFDGAGPINTLDRLRAKQELAAAEAHVDVALLATLAPDGGWREADRLAHGGAAGFKVSLFDTNPVRFPRISDPELLDVMSAVADTGRTLCVHAENNEIVQALLAHEAAANPDDAGAHARSRPPVSETLGVLTAMEIAADRGAALHLCHLSLGRSVALARWYAEQGVDLTFETCPHYLTFDEQAVHAQRGLLKINPPLREAAQRESLWRSLDAGEIPVISSDHAPWPLDLKDRDRILDNRSGAPGVQTLVALTLGAALARGEQTFTHAVDALTITPAGRFGIDARKGSLEPGKDGDVTIFQPDDDAEIVLAEQLSHAGWSPYEGLRPGGRVTMTLSRGEVVFTSDEGVLARPGRGALAGGDA